MRHLREDVLALPRRIKAPREGLLNLSSNELLHPRVPDLLAQAAAELDPALFQRYPTYEGAIGDLSRHHGVGEDQVLLAAGSNDAIKMLVEALAATSGRMILPQPNYEGWSHYAALRRIQVTEIPFGARREGAFSLEQLEEAVRAAPPSTVALSNPNAPTGACFGEAEMQALSAACREHGHLLIVDECYVDFSDVDHRSLLEDGDHVILVRTFSKSFGLAGARIASVVAAPAVIDYLARWRPEFPVSGASMALLRGMLRRADDLRAIWADLLAARSWLADTLAARWPAWRPLPSQANFVNVRVRSSEEAAHLTARLMARRIRIKSTDGMPGLSRCIRMTVADQPTLEQVLAVIAEEIGPV